MGKSIAPTKAAYVRHLANALAQSAMFAAVETKALKQLASQADWFSLPGGQMLIEAGGNSGGVHIVISGRLAAISHGTEIGLIEAGETVGELALISGGTHMASVRAARDCELLFLPKAAIETALLASPAGLWVLLKLLVARQQRGSTASRAPRLLAVITVTPRLSAPDIANRLAQSCQELGVRTVVVTAAQRGDLARIEALHDLVILAAGATVEPTPGTVDEWLGTCLRQSDRALLVADDSVSALPAALAAVLQRAPRPQFDLLLIDALGQAQGWRARLPLAQAINAASGNSVDFARAARVVTNRAIGVVLSGGGARGFAHLGVLRALDEIGVPVDLLAGVSMGSVIAAGAAAGWSSDESLERFRASFVATNPLRDFTLPLLALTRGNRVTAMLRRAFGESLIENLHRSFFCLSSNLTTAAGRLHDSGPVCSAVRASLAIPGLLPPVVENGDVLVDGGLINNLPVDIMRSLGRGPVIGVDVGSQRSVSCTQPSLDGSGLRWLRGDGGVPRIATVLVRAGTVSSAANNRRLAGEVDIMLRPDVDGIPILDWASLDRAADVGYRSTMHQIEELGPEVRARLGLA